MVRFSPGCFAQHHPKLCVYCCVSRYYTTSGHTVEVHSKKSFPHFILIGFYSFIKKSHKRWYLIFHLFFRIMVSSICLTRGNEQSNRVAGGMPLSDKSSLVVLARRLIPHLFPRSRASNRPRTPFIYSSFIICFLHFIFLFVSSFFFCITFSTSTT